MNKFLNENWKDAAKDIAPAFIEVIKSIVLKIINSFTNDIPFNEIFTP